MKPTIWFLAITTSSFFYACDKDITDTDNSAVSATSALTTVSDCVKQRHDCGALAKTEDEARACSAQLRMCIQPLAGGKPGDLIPDAGIVVPPTGMGTMPPAWGTLPPISGLPDAGGGRPAVDAGLPGVPTMPPGGGIAAGLKDCLGTLRDCLSASMSDPMMCATEVRDCIKSLF
jgi:hypothetical protein